MKIYIGHFVKKNGEVRKMQFVRLEDLPDSFLASKIKGSDKTKKVLKEGNELVWDIEKKEFRVFNWNSVVGNVVPLIKDESILHN